MLLLELATLQVVALAALCRQVTGLRKTKAILFFLSIFKFKLEWFKFQVPKSWHKVQDASIICKKLGKRETKAFMHSFQKFVENLGQKSLQKNFFPFVKSLREVVLKIFKAL